MTLYNLTKSECKCLADNYNTENLALLLWNKGKAKTLESGIKKVRKQANYKTAQINGIENFLN